MMADMGAIAGALVAFNNAKNIAQAMITLRDAAAFQGKMIEFQSAILDAQGAAFAANDERTALLEQVRQLKEQVADLEAWEAQKQRYDLKPGLSGGAFVYALKPEAQGTEPPHWICATCYEDHRRSILQRGQHEGRDWPWQCPVCKTTIWADFQGPNKF